METPPKITQSDRVFGYGLGYQVRLITSPASGVCGVANKFRLASHFQLPRMFPILKIPFTLATTLALHVAATALNPPPPEIERPTKVKTMMSNRFVSIALQYFFPVIKVRKLPSSSEVRE